LANTSYTPPIKTAIISTIPIGVAKSFLIQSNLGIHSGTRKIFNNVDMALTWLEFDNSKFTIIKNTIQALKKT